jgi:polyisoprenoid-binding protein YceI
MHVSSHLLVAALVFQSFNVALAEEVQVPEPAPSGAYVSDQPHTSLTWKVSHFGLSNFTARFVGIDAQLGWNAEDPSRSTLTVAIDPRSVRTDFPFPEQEDFDAKIGTDPAFLADQPITFRATELEIIDASTGTIRGDLTFRGQTHPMTLDVRFNGSFAQHPMDQLPTIGFSATGSLDRTLWGLDFAVPAVGADVSLQIEAEFKPAT